MNRSLGIEIFSHLDFFRICLAIPFNTKTGEGSLLSGGGERGGKRMGVILPATLPRDSREENNNTDNNLKFTS